jgi:hypothetical protein
VPVKLCDDFNWDKGVFEQPWPQVNYSISCVNFFKYQKKSISLIVKSFQVDPTYNLEMKILGKGRELARIPIARWKFDQLTEEEAFDLACHVPEVQSRVLPHTIHSKLFTKHEAFEATLDIDYELGTETKVEELLSPEEFKKKREEEKELRRQEKEAKKAARAKRIQEMEESERKKATKSFPKKKQG